MVVVVRVDTYGCGDGREQWLCRGKALVIMVSHE